jgi:hypothetical protein
MDSIKVVWVRGADGRRAYVTLFGAVVDDGPRRHQAYVWGRKTVRPTVVGWLDLGAHYGGYRGTLLQALVTRLER